MAVDFANAPRSVLSAWTALEVLSPPAFREPEELIGGDKNAVAHLIDGRLPWENGGEQARFKTRHYYQLILGTVDLEQAVHRLTAVYQDKPVEPLLVRGKAILAVALLDHQGIPVKDKSAAVSSFAWGLPQALAGKLDVLGSWPTAERPLNDSLTLRLKRIDQDGAVLPLTVETLKEAFDWLVDTLGLSRELVQSPQYALRVYESSTYAGQPEPLHLNSFLLNYLVSALGQFDQGEVPQNLKLFLGAAKPTQRRDLLNDQRSLSAAVRPALFAPARWPGPGRHPLVLLQQAAVNLALRELKDHGILAVNGPPGTGKTTLLRDIVAAIITERARVMASFDDPASAFINSGNRFQAGNGHFQLYTLDPKLRGFEILVASSNNKAVENISAELPGTAAIAADAEALRYFKTTSDALQTSRRNTWGLIAAVLGNSGNRRHFKKIFWWDKDVGVASYLLAASGHCKNIEHIDPHTGKTTERLPQIVANESAPFSHEQALLQWRQARIAFQEALARSEKALQEIEILHASQEAGEMLMRARDADAAAQAELRQHLACRPEWWKGLFFTPQARRWRLEAALKAKETQEAVESLRRAQLKVTELQAAVRHSDPTLRARLGTRLVDERFFDRKRTEYQQEPPWLDDRAHRLRDEVFIAAMVLHKAFIGAAAKPLRHNLGVLMTSFGGRATISPERDALFADLWTSLFLVVPVVSTTFASVDRMLGKLPSEAFGWLLIDEAGQAPPQAAVGALMKTRRAVVVGDPMQIEPVVSLPVPLTEMICRRFSVDPKKFNAPAASVQTLADEATSCMAALESQHGNRTVGVPLLIHRRCAEPMFGLSNAVAYDRLMIHARGSGQSRIRALLGPSHWVDVCGEAEDKWCPQEGLEVVALLRKLAHARIDPDLYVVTPFVVVQNRLREVILKSGVLDGWVAAPRDWVRQRVGTIHVVQGREAEAVIFVLGAQGSQQSGARAWAGEGPNLLNVAVSRAKEALYVVGNRQLWRSAGLFSELDAHLPAIAAQEKRPDVA